MATPPRDVREALQASLGWNFVFPSSESSAVRCLVAHPQDESQLAEWLVRALPPLPPSSESVSCSQAQATAHNYQPIHPCSDLETLLAHKLSFKGLEQHIETSKSFMFHQSHGSELQTLSSTDVLKLLYTDIPLYVPTNNAQVTQGLFANHARRENPHLPLLRGVYTDPVQNCSYAIFKYHPQSFQDVLKYNHSVLDGHPQVDVPSFTTEPQNALGDLKKRLVLYQLTRILAFLHTRGLACHGFTPRELFLSDTLWVHLAALPRILDACIHARKRPYPDQIQAPQLFRDIESYTSRSMTDRWSTGDMSNLAYLLALNTAAGRRMEDGIFHPFVPWVTDFTAGPFNGWRDLSKSKFRLNKGDAQLDRTFASSAVPHHITESLSEITYYIYAARRTPMALLRRVVRGDFQAKEYPATMARMFEWTPDECVPEFYLDARIFTSLHHDEMEDLEFPAWGDTTNTNAAVAFVTWHRKMLESDRVSSQLHLWIDLNFGAALSGDAAIRAKNVPLFVQATEKSPGFVQLFKTAHPPRVYRCLNKEEGALERLTQNVDLSHEDAISRAGWRPQGMKKEVNAMLSRAMHVIAETQKDLNGSGPLASIGSGGHGKLNAMGARGLVFSDVETSRFGLLHSQSAGETGTNPVTLASPTDGTRSQVIMRNLKHRRRGGHKLRTRSQVNATTVLESQGSPSMNIVSNTRETQSPSTPSLGTSASTRLGTLFYLDSSNPTNSGTNNSFTNGLKTWNGSEASGSSPNSGASYNRTNSRSLTGSNGPVDHLRVLTNGTSQPGTSVGLGHDRREGTHHARHASLGSGSPNPGTHLLRDLWQQIRQPEDDGSHGGSSHRRSVSASHDVLVPFNNVLGDMLMSDLDMSTEAGGCDGSEPLDEVDCKLLQLGLRIILPTPETDVKGDTTPCNVVQGNLEDDLIFADAIIDPIYSIPEELEVVTAHDLTLFERAQAADIFSFGCLVAELYTRSPIFSRRSLEQYLAAYARHQTQCQATAPEPSSWISRYVSVSCKKLSTNQRLWWNHAVSNRLAGLPLNLKNGVLDMLHPDPRQRLLLVSQIDGFEWIQARQLDSCQSSQENQCVLSTLPPHAVHAAPSAWFPHDMMVVYMFLKKLHTVPDQNWHARLTLTRQLLSSLTNLSELHFRVAMPELVRFFRARSHTESIRVECVTAAVVFLLPEMARQLGRDQARAELLSDVVRLYEKNDLAPLYRCCLAAPKVVLSVLQAFGAATILDTFVPVILEWLVPPTAADVDVTLQSSMTPDSIHPAPLPPFAAESAALAAVTCGELSSPLMLGPSLTVKYVLPALLNQLGRAKSRWTHLAESKPLRRTDRKVSIASGGGHGQDTEPEASDFHLTFLLKAKLYESHHVADAVLQICREVGEYAVIHLLLPRLFDVLPKLVTLAEKIASVRIEGVPEELGREIYVLLRMLRHVVRTLNDPTALHDLLSRRARSNLMDLLAQTSPPFLSPRVATAVIAAATASKRHFNDSLPPTKTSRFTKKVLQSFNGLKDADHRNLRAFTVVGLSRTIAAVCQKLGPDAVVSDSTVVNGLNRFLKRCSDVYAELEVSNFQWDLASELMSELCVPLRLVLGKEMFSRTFPIVAGSSVLQLLLLPLGNPEASGRNHEARSSSRHLSALDDRLGKSQQMLLNPDERADQIRTEDEPTLKNTWFHTDTVTPEEYTTYPPELLRTAYHAVRLHAVRATSFLRIPSTLLVGSGSTATHWESALNNELICLQEARRERKVGTSADERPNADAVWLRPRVVQPFDTRYEDLNTTASPLKTSWALVAEIRQSLKAHSSAISCTSVDLEEEIVLTGSRHGSCRVWRLSDHPMQARAAASITMKDTRPVLAVARVGSAYRRGAMEVDGGMAVAASASCVLLWDLSTSQMRMRLPFSATLEPIVAMTIATSGINVAVATAHRVLGIDARGGPRVVAEWGADPAGLASLLPHLSLTAMTSFLDTVAYLVLGTSTGYIVLLDSRTGRYVIKWQALEAGARIVHVVQISKSQLLVLGAEKEARVWRMELQTAKPPQLRMTITGVPEGVCAAQVTVQSGADTSVLYVAFGARVYCALLPMEPRAVVLIQPPVMKRMEVWQLSEPGGASRSSRSRVVAQSVAVLPLRQLLLLGTDDGCLKGNILVEYMYLTFGLVDGILMKRGDFAAVGLPIGALFLLVAKNVLTVLLVPVHVWVAREVTHALCRTEASSGYASYENGPRALVTEPSLSSALNNSAGHGD
ncbi:hypothetical protein CCR75_007447 [Bremia lactucae]|uniref:BEACH domain-containing protein n=1 Tax=Bremia lactucae TaxID=4779 RepID=A0A976NYI8_BRELC|nr:hypothetical protein CCR75_007447 [Bremia lactucae]